MNHNALRTPVLFKIYAAMCTGHGCEERAREWSISAVASALPVCLRLSRLHAVRECRRTSSLGPREAKQRKEYMASKLATLACRVVDFMML